MDMKTSVGDYVDDAAITTKLKAELLADPDLSAMEISVETDHGTVQLSGFVNSLQAKAKAVELARRSNGVKEVKDSIIVRE